ncbi:DUF4349 domain-containing protein [Paenibacillus swuensis]|nr:DUF4349 domain-containing protein [Paenibacillus swuensis]
MKMFKQGCVMMLLTGMLAMSACSAADNNSGADAKMNSLQRSSDNSAAMEGAAESAPADKAMEQDQNSQESKVESDAETPMSAGSLGNGTAASSPVSSSGQPVLNQKLIYRANLTMEVKDYAKTQSQIQNLIHLSGGYLIQFTDSKTSNELGGNYKIKVPAQGFMSFIGELEKMKPVELQRSMQGTDVSEEYVDLESRLKAKQVVEARLLSFMEKAQKASDLVAFSKELGGVQEEIERFKGRMRYLDENVAFSTIELRVYQPVVQTAVKDPEEKDALFARAGAAMKSSGAFLVALFEGVVVLLAGLLPLLIILIPVGGFMYFMYNKNRRNKGRPTDSDPGSS